MSEPNNLCRALIVYGSYAPGGERHKIFSELPGTWVPGKILANLVEAPDHLGPGSGDVIEAWLIEFSDCQAEMFTPEHELQSKQLWERWTNLDQSMGASWARSSQRWWPENQEPVVSSGMRVVNIYLPLENYPWLRNREDAPHPDDRDNPPKLWAQVLSGEKKYSKSHFLALIKDAHPRDFEKLFGSLPNSKEFVRRLRAFYRDHELSPGSLLNDTKNFYLYASPRQRNELSPEKLLDLARADLEQKKLLLEKQTDESAKALDKLYFELVTEVEFRKIKEEASDDWTDAEEALEIASDLIIDGSLQDHWYWCLDEACYGIAASFDLRDWLMSVWNTCPIDFEPSYLLWKGGGQYGFVGETCYVFTNTSRSA